MLSDCCLSCPVLSCLSVLSVCDVGVLWPYGWMDEDATWCGGRPRPRPHFVRWEPSSPIRKGHNSPSPFSAHVSWPNGWMDQDATWYVGMPWSMRHCVRWVPSCRPSPNGAQHTPLFCPGLLWPNGWMNQDAT